MKFLKSFNVKISIIKFYISSLRRAWHCQFLWDRVANYGLF